MANLSEKIIGKIKQKSITPTPKIFFTLYNLSVWSIGILFFVIGVLSATLLFYFSKNLEIFYFLLNSPQNLINSAAIFIPLFWIFCVLILVFFLGLSIGKTKKGYKYPLLWIFIGVIITQIVIGFGLSNAQVIEKIGDQVEEKLFFLGKIEDHRKKIWNNPKNGFLLGEIISVSQDKSFVIKTSEGTQWSISTTDTTTFHPDVALEKQKLILIKGKVQGTESQFLAEHILPFLKKPARKASPKEKNAHRKKMKEYFQNLKESNPEIAQELKEHRKINRPHIECETEECVVKYELLKEKRMEKRPLRDSE